MSRGLALTACGLAACGFVGLGACGDVDAQPIGGAPPDGALAEGGGSDGGPVVDASGESDAPVPPDDASSFCTGQGPIPLGNGQCTGDVAHLFRFAACACDSLAVSGQLLTSAGDAGSAASIAANGQVATNAQATVGGSVWAAGQSLASGEPAVSLMSPSGTTSTVAYDVQSGSGVTTGGTVLVGGSLYADGNVTVQSGSLSVVGTVTVPGGDSANGVTAGGGVVNASVEVTPPCDCSDLVDVASIVSAHASSSSNDDSPSTLSVGSLDNPTSKVLVPCGLFYVDAIQGTSSAISIEVTGRAALFVGKDLDAEDGITITVDSGASLDLFVAGDVTLEGNTILNGSGTAASMRMYVGGSTMTLAAAATVNANLYAPAADVQLASNFVMSGAFFAGSLQFSGDFSIDYDVSILQTPGCTPPGSSCTSCNDCAGATPACKGGKCSTCSTNADCCPPLLCDAPPTGNGTCVPPLQ